MNNEISIEVSEGEAARFPAGFSCASRNVGLKQSGPDLSLFMSDVDAAAAAVFTRNHFPGAPVIRGRTIIRAGVLRAIVVNSKFSNVATGAAGLDHAERMAAAAARELGVLASRVLVSSTGVIGVRLPIEKIEAGMVGIVAERCADPLAGARGIMTTDSYPKAVSVSAGASTITIVAKGSGMIAPDMATMLAYIFTDADIDAGQLDAELRAVVPDTFNMLSVDGDTSTSDTCVIMANGRAGAVDMGQWRRALAAACTRMTELLARDGEGATKLLRVTVSGAASREDARLVARSLVESPLIKTMAYGADPNVGRILMAIGKCFSARIEPTKTRATIAGNAVVENGLRIDFDEAALRAVLASDTIDIGVELGVGTHGARAWGCDLTEGYITENASYFSS